MTGIPRYAAALGLVLALILGQEAIALHALQHAQEQLADAAEGGLPQPCEDHQLFTTTAASPPAEAPSIFADALHARPAARGHATATSAARPAFRPRAPPAAPCR